MISEPDWGSWRVIAEADTASFITELTNANFGAQFEFEQSCEQIAEPDAEVSHWFRLSTLVEAIGVGMVEYGCWVDGASLKTRSTVAFHSDALSDTCLRVEANRGGGLNLRSGPGLEQPRLTTFANGTRITWVVSPSALQIDESGRSWLAVTTPQAGYVSVRAAPGATINLTPCDV
ncbi:MAG: SH3 domain-containing protein [Cyanobacteria bacterium J06642_11]